jgi:exodeoxyribonuclease V alpha subunit
MRYGVHKVTVSIIENGVRYVQGRQFIFRAADHQGEAERYVSDEILLRCPQPGECWELEYRDDQHQNAERPELAYQRKVVAGTLLKPNGRYLIGLLAHHPAMRGLGIGVIKATELYDLHGTNLVDLLDKGDSKAVSGLSEDVAWNLIERWKALAIEPEVVKWFTQHNLDARLATKILRLYRAQSVEMLEVNPYCLHTFMPFQTVDAFARVGLGVPYDNPNRLVAAVENVLYRAMDRGHTTVRRSHLEQALCSVAAGLEEDAIALALNRECAFERGDFIQAVAPAIMERFIEQWITESKESRQSEFEMHEAGVEARLEQHADSASIELNPEQREAILGAFRNHIHCIAGGAGVGKTTVLKLLAQLILDASGTACFMAISGRATRRIAESLGLDIASRCIVKTVAGFLHSQLDDEKKLPWDSSPWLIVDESSMLDLQSAYWLLARSPRKSRLVLVGDPGQLPPVGCGLVFHRLVESHQVKTTELKRVYRQAAATGIPTVALSIRQGVLPALPPFRGPGHGVQMVQTSLADAIPEAIHIAGILANAGPVQILTVFKSTYGAGAVNRAMHAALPQGTLKLTTAILDFAVGEPVIFKRNNLELNLQNGSIGQVLAVNNENKSVTVRWDDGRDLVMKGLDLWDCDLAHGITAHKSQGSQYERVIIVIPRYSSLILDRTLVYRCRGLRQLSQGLSWKRTSTARLLRHM